MWAIITCRSSGTDVVEEHRELREVDAVRYATEDSESLPGQDPSYNTCNEENGSPSDFTETSDHALSVFRFMK
jgi:hypothetical protein